MTTSRKLIISALLSLFSVLIIFLTRSLPQSQIWKGYKTVYEPGLQITHSENIYSILYSSGLTKTVSSVNQKIPLFSKLSPVQLQDENSYLVRRSAFFTDKSGTYSVFYVPDSQSSKLVDAIEKINGYPETFAGTDGGTVFPWLSPFLCLILTAFLFYKARQKINYIISVFPDFAL